MELLELDLTVRDEITLAQLRRGSLLERLLVEQPVEQIPDPVAARVGRLQNALARRLWRPARLKSVASSSATAR
jgi:hypothetical protein